MSLVKRLISFILAAAASATRSREQRKFESEVADPDLVFRRYFDQIYRYCRQRLYRDADAEDVTAQVFAEAIRSMPKLKWKGKPVLAFLYTVAGRRITDFKRRDREQAVDFDEVQEPSDTTPPTEILANGGELGKAIDALPEDQRVCVYLQLVQGHSFKEVAEIVGRAEKACKGLVYRGLEQLRQDLAEKGLEPA